MRQLFKPLAFFDLFKEQISFGELFRYSQLKAEELLNLLNFSPLVLRHGLNYSTNQFPPSIREVEGIGDLANDLRLRKRLKIARRVGFWIRLLPSVRLVAVANNLSFSVATTSGDIDLFIITSKETISITRLVVVVLLVILRLRPKAGRIDPVCASFFVSEAGLDLSGLTMANDIYFRFWLGALLPLYDPDNLLPKVFEINSSLLVEFPNLSTKIVCPQMRLSARGHFLKVFMSLLRCLEPMIFKLQFKFFSKDIKKMLNLDTRVVVTDKVLKFHTNDRREYFRNRLENIL